MKFWLIFAVAAVGILVAQGSPKEGIAKEQKGFSAEKPAAANDEQSDSKVTVIVKQENAPPENPKKEQDDENIQIQRRVAEFTALLVIVGLIQAVILWFTIRAVNKQTATNQHIERAWIMAELRFSKDGQFFNGDHTENGIVTPTLSVMGVELICANDGNSPAWITEKAMRLVVLRPEEKLPTTPMLDSKDVIQDHPEPLGPGRDSKKVLDMQGEGRHSLKTSTLIYGVIHYRDIFREKRETWFCYAMSGYKSHYILTRTSDNPEYNKNT